MQRILRSLTPHWLRQLDHSLLISRPAIWATRIHFVLFYGGVALGIAALLGYYTASSVDQASDITFRTSYMIIPSALMFGFWTWMMKGRMDRIPKHSRNRVAHFSLCLGGSLIIFAFPFVFGKAMLIQLLELLKSDEFAFRVELLGYKGGGPLFFSNYDKSLASITIMSIVFWFQQLFLVVSPRRFLMTLLGVSFWFSLSFAMTVMIYPASILAAIVFLFIWRGLAFSEENMGNLPFTATMMLLLGIPLTGVVLFYTIEWVNILLEDAGLANAFLTLAGMAFFWLRYLLPQLEKLQSRPLVR